MVPRRFPQVLRKLLFSLLVFAAFVAAAEFVLRATHLFGAYLAWTEPHPLYAWRFLPERDFWFFGENDHPITGRTNRGGWRDVDHAEAKPPGTCRVVILGDSFVEALQVEIDSTFFRLAEQRLRDGGIPAEVIAMGQSGAAQTEEYLWIQHEVPAYDPDVVVVVFTPYNDVRDAGPAPGSDTPTRAHYRPLPGGGLELDTSFVDTDGYRSQVRRNAVRRRSALVSLLVVKAQQAMGSYEEKRRQRPDRITGLESLATGSPDSLMAARYALCKVLLRTMADHCAERGWRFVLTSVPFCHRPEDEARLRSLDPTFDPDFFENDFAALADTSGFTYLPLQAPFREAHVTGGRPLFWGHWNYEGHRLTARLLAEGIAPLLREP